MPAALVSHTIVGGGASGFTASPISTTGATLIVVGVAWYTAGSILSISDSDGNTYTRVTPDYTSGDPNFTWFYCLSPTTSSANTVSCSASVAYTSGIILAFSGVTGLDQSSTGAGGNSIQSLQPGSQTPTQANCLLIAGVGIDTVATLSIDSGFTLVDQQNYLGGNYYGMGSAYLVETSAAAKNPTWTWTGACAASNSLIVFQGTGGGGVTVHSLPMMGLGS